MIRRRLSPSLLLTLALVLGQWMTLAHAFEHPALAQNHSCQICAHAQGLDGAALWIAPPLMVPAVPVEAPASPLFAAPQRAAVSSYDIRGPPTALQLQF